MIPGDSELHLKQLAHALREKKLRMATHKEAEALTGLKVGGISVLALRHKHFQVYLDHAAERLEHILVSAGQRGVDVRLKVTDLVQATGAVFVEATVPAPAMRQSPRPSLDNPSPCRSDSL
jgi:Cys-tRNA(Pro)/Cys-tRNA(Cys) deacylase